MVDYVLLNLLNKLGKEINCEACRAFFHNEKTGEKIPLVRS